MKKSKFFKIQELVPEEVYNRLGDKAWKLFSDETMINLDLLRLFFGKPILINNWHIGGNFSQRGLRTNISRLVQEKSSQNILYLSAHLYAFGFDINVAEETSEQTFNKIIENQEKLPFIFRMESKIDKQTKKIRNWTHIELKSRDEGAKIEIFEA